MTTLVRFLFVIFLLVPNGVALYMFKLASDQNDKVRLLDSGPTQTVGERPFVAEGVLKSPSGKSLKSMHFEEPCIGYRIQLDLMHTVTDSEGEEEDRRVELMDERRQVPDLTVEFPNGKGLLDLQVVESFYNPRFEELDDLPEYVDYERIPKIKTNRFWFQVFENIFTEGQKVTVLGRLNKQGVLEPHIGAGELIVYPGNTVECAEALKETGNTYKIIGFVFIGVSVLGCLILAGILRVTRKNR